MFLLRSAFWLTIGFMLVAPHGTDFGAAANALKDQAVTAGIEAGEQLIVSQITANPGLIALSTLSTNPSVARPTMQGSATGLPVFPRARPAALG